MTAVPMEKASASAIQAKTAPESVCSNFGLFNTLAANEKALRRKTPS